MDRETPSAVSAAPPLTAEAQHDLATRIRVLASGLEEELIRFRRTMHSEPELAFTEHRATARVMTRLKEAGLNPSSFPRHTGLFCDIDGTDARRIGLRADLDALPVIDTKDVSYKSQFPGLCHACGHDVHTTVVLGAGLVLLELAREQQLPNSVRLIFQPAEETMPGGAVQVIAGGVLRPLSACYALHCDPTVQRGQVGLREGPITSASDHLELRLRPESAAGPGAANQTISAWAGLVGLIQQAISAQIDPRSRLSVIWGKVESLESGEVICKGTLRCTDESFWDSAPDWVGQVVRNAALSFPVDVELHYTRGVPPTVNAPTAIHTVARAASVALGDSSIVQSEQSLAGEDFAWYLRELPGALVRLGVRPDGQDHVTDLHKSDFNVDERAIRTGVELLCMTAVMA